MNHIQFNTFVFFSHFPPPPKIVSFLPSRKLHVLDFFVLPEIQAHILYLHVPRKTQGRKIFFKYLEASL